MSIYRYSKLSKVAKKARLELERSGVRVKKRFRLKGRSEEKQNLLFEMALNRLKKYAPKKTEKGIIFPYLYTKLK